MALARRAPVIRSMASSAASGTLGHVVLERLVGEPGIRVDPGDDEHGVALLDRPAHEGVLRREVQDIELVDPGRDDQQRHLVDGLRRRVVLDELHEVVAQHDLAGRDGDIAADLEGGHVGLRDAQLPLSGLQVAEQVLEAAQQVLAIAVHRFAEDPGVGGGEIGRRHRIDELARVEGNLVGVVPVGALGFRQAAEQEARGQQIGLLDEVENEVLSPGGVLEAAVARLRFCDRRHRLAAHHPARRVLPELRILLGELRLGGHHARRVGHHPRRHFEEGPADAERVRVRRTAFRPVPGGEFRRHALAAFGDLPEAFGERILVECAGHRVASSNVPDG